MFNKFIIFIFIFLFFSYIPYYLVHLSIISFKPVVLVVISFLIIIIMYLKNKKLKIPNFPLYKWLFIYLFVNLIWYIFPNNKFKVNDLLLIIYFTMFIFFYTLLINKDNSKNYEFTRKTILLVTILSVINNILEFIFPYLFIPRGANFGVLGRSAGFYINPNISSSSILLGMIFNITLIPNKYRLIFVIFVFIGVFFTFSKAGILSFFLLLTLFIVFKIIELKKILICIFILAFFVIIFSSQLVVYFYNHVGSYNILNRILWFVHLNKHTDNSTLTRKLLLEKCFELFQNNPIFGAGLGASKYWEYNVASHNMYMLFLSELGIIGLFLYLSFFIFLTIKTIKKNEKVAILFLIFCLLFGFVSHNLLEQSSFLISYALMANLNKRFEK